MLVAAHVSGVSAAFPFIIGQFGVTVANGQWILTAYTLALTACLLSFGGLADRIGFLRVYISGLAVFGTSSGACALVSSAWALILLRGVQGVGAAMVSATSVALIGISVPQRRLGRALGWQTGMTYAGLTLGPLVAGYVAQRFGWRMLFALNLPAAAVAIVAVRRAPSQQRGDSHESSWAGILWMAGVVAFMLALSGKTGRIYAASVATLCAASFLWMNQRSRDPMFAAWMVRSRQFSAAAAGETIYYACLYAIGFLMPLYLARGRGLTGAQVGAFLAFQNAARSLAAPASGRMSDRFGARVVVWLGIVFLALAACCLCAFGGDTNTTGIWGALVLLGTGAGLFAPANSQVLLYAAPIEKYGASTGILATARNLGMTLGVTLAALLYSEFGGDITAIRTVHAVRAALVVIAGTAIVFAALGVPSQRWNISKAEQFETS
jgi:MFS family permease